MSQVGDTHLNGRAIPITKGNPLCLFIAVQVHRVRVRVGVRGAGGAGCAPRREAGLTASMPKQQGGCVHLRGATAGGRCGVREAAAVRESRGHAARPNSAGCGASVDCRETSILQQAGELSKRAGLERLCFIFCKPRGGHIDVDLSCTPERPG